MVLESVDSVFRRKRVDRKIKILLVEDDEKGAQLLSYYLHECGFAVNNVYSITDAISHASVGNYDIALLDLNLPDYTGMEFLRSIKNRISLPVIVISAYSDTASKIQAFKYGAGDYMVKPLDLEELEARIWVLLGRSGEIGIEKREKRFEISGDDIFYMGKRLDLTSTEYDILSILIRNSGNTVSRERITESLHISCSPRSLDNHIKNIRKKIKSAGAQESTLKTVYGQGYLLRH
jgi:DNA-binding response OmpR family regulator